MIFAQLIGTLSGNVLEVMTSGDGDNAEIQVVAYGKLEGAIEELDGSKVAIAGDLAKKEGDWEITATSVNAVPEDTEATQFSACSLLTPTDNEIRATINEDTILQLSSYTKNSGRDAGLTGLKLKFFNPTEKMTAMLGGFGVEGNKTQLFVQGNLDFYVGEGDDGAYTIASMWSKSFEIVRSGDAGGGTAGAKSSGGASKAKGKSASTGGKRKKVSF